MGQIFVATFMRNNVQVVLAWDADADTLKVYADDANNVCELSVPTDEPCLTQDDHGVYLLGWNNNEDVLELGVSQAPFPREMCHLCA